MWIFTRSIIYALITLIDFKTIFNYVGINHFMPLLSYLFKLYMDLSSLHILLPCPGSKKLWFIWWLFIRSYIVAIAISDSSYRKKIEKSNVSFLFKTFCNNSSLKIYRLYHLVYISFKYPFTTNSCKTRW